MRIVNASWSLALLAIACGSEDQASGADRTETNAAVVHQPLTRTVLASANFETGLVPFTNPEGFCASASFTGSTGNGAVCFFNSVLNIEIDARRFSDIQITYKRGTTDYDSREFLGAFLPGDFLPSDFIIGSAPVAPGVINLGRRLEDSKFTLSFQGVTIPEGGLDFDIFLLDDFVVTGTPVPDDSCDGVDQDGDGVFDEDFIGELTQCGFGVCANSARKECRNGQVVDVCVPIVTPDVTCDGIDNDCDMRIDEDSPCGSPYRTMIIMGDTQSLSYPETVGPLREIVDWIVDNRDKDNIDAVLQVGDLIEQGQVVKSDKFTMGCGTARTECAGNIPDVGPHSACRLPGNTEALPSLPCGCFSELPRPRANAFTGYSCGQIVRDVDAEWALVQSELFRLNDRVPYAVVRGNHDNPSKVDFLNKGPFAINQPRGLRDYFGPDFYMAQQTRFSTGPRQFRVLGIGSKLLSYAFQFKLGGRQDVTLVALDDFDKSAIPVAQSFLTTYENSPTILLAHRGLYRPAAGVADRDSAFWRAFIEPQEGAVGPFARQIFMTAQGHIVQNTHEDITIGSNLGRVLRIAIDNQVPAPPLPAPPMLTLPDATYMTAVRFYLDSNEVEIVTVSARENKVVMPRPSFGLSRRLFPIARSAN